MQTCSNHSHRPAAWQCSRCGRSLCEECAQGEQKPGLPTVVCVHCGGIAKAIRKPKAIRKYWQMFPDFLGALFGWKGLLQLLAVAVVVQVCMFLGILGVGVGWGLYAGYYFLVLRTASIGSLELPKPADFSNPVDDILLPLIRLFLAMTLPIVPPIAYLILRYKAGFLAEPMALLTDPILLVICLVCIAWVPGALIVAAMNESAAAQLNPLSVLSIVSRIPKEYALTVLVWIGLQVANGALSFGGTVLAETVPIPIVMPILLRFVGLFVPMLTAMILGRLIYQNSQVFGLPLTQDEMEPVQPMAIPRGRLHGDTLGSSFLPGGPIPAVESSVAPWETPRTVAAPSRLRPATAASIPPRKPAVAASIAPWEKPAAASMPSAAEDSIPLDGDEGPRATPPGFDGPVTAGAPTERPFPGFAAAEESIPLNGSDEGPRGVRPGMDPVPPGSASDPFAPSPEQSASFERPGDPAGRPSFEERSEGRFDETPEPIPLFDMPQPGDEGIAGALHVGPGGTFSQQPQPDQPSSDPDSVPVDHQPPAEDFAPQTLGGGLPPSAETSTGDAAAISISWDAGALDNPLRMALESGDAHSAMMNYREQLALGQQPDLPVELEMRLAEMLEQAGQFGDAVSACKRASEREPEGPLAARATYEGARVLVERLGNRAQGTALLQYLLRHYGQDPAAEPARQLLAQLQDQ